MPFLNPMDIIHGYYPYNLFMDRTPKMIHLINHQYRSSKADSPAVPRSIRSANPPWHCHIYFISASCLYFFLSLSMFLFGRSCSSNSRLRRLPFFSLKNTLVDFLKLNFFPSSCMSWYMMMHHDRSVDWICCSQGIVQLQAVVGRQVLSNRPVPLKYSSSREPFWQNIPCRKIQNRSLCWLSDMVRIKRASYDWWPWSDCCREKRLKLKPTSSDRPFRLFTVLLYSIKFIAKVTSLKSLYWKHDAPDVEVQTFKRQAEHHAEQKRKLSRSPI